MAQEKQLEEKLKRWLESIGVYRLGTDSRMSGQPPRGYYVKRWGGGRYMQAGLPDMQIVIDGQCLEVELKSERGVVSELQQQKVEQVNESGGCALIVRPSGLDDFKRMVLTRFVR